MTINELPKLSKNEMENLFKQSKRRSFVFMMFTLLWAAFCIWQYFTTSNLILKKSLFTFFCIALGLWFIIIIGQLIFFKLVSTNLSEFKEKQIGQFTIEEVRTLVDEVFKVSLTSEKPTLYIMNLEMVNAFAINIYMLNFLKPANAVYITINCFKCMTREEIKAMLLHEMGHFNKYIYDENKILNTGIFLLLIMPFAFIVLIPGFLFKVGFVLLTITMILIIWSKLRNSKDYDKHILEYLSDLYAAEKEGLLNTVNMLITLAKENVVTEEKEKNEILKKILVPVKRFMVDWTAFDTHIVNGKIELEEYPKMIETLEKFENPQLVNHSAVDHNSNSHPSLTNRILFLNRNLKP
jgi:Zn-dependent protease with chaperone function